MFERTASIRAFARIWGSGRKNISLIDVQVPGGSQDALEKKPRDLEGYDKIILGERVLQRVGTYQVSNFDRLSNSDRPMTPAPPSSMSSASTIFTTNYAGGNAQINNVNGDYVQNVYQMTPDQGGGISRWFPRPFDRLTTLSTNYYLAYLNTTAISTSTKHRKEVLWFTGIRALQRERDALSKGSTGRVARDPSPQDPTVDWLED
ncbi:hypothetical protein FIBSPDRAFT_894516 [Athelia psychrophila]|uniref:Uncharacterized protein n=1 Tax=Athelia psychrophila TaxID=1759441 RepID=A0A166FSD5_9AGAM|nr:hypothetical protein FIBSPDRAFT_894516 [Fibularhizoctonia sp. CBS 109695]